MHEIFVFNFQTIVAFVCFEFQFIPVYTYWSTPIIEEVIFVKIQSNFAVALIQIAGGMRCRLKTIDVLR